MSTAPKLTFRSRAAAAAHLSTLGWEFSNKSFGDWVYRHPTSSHYNLIVQLANGSWRIDAYGAAAGFTGATVFGKAMQVS